MLDQLKIKFQLTGEIKSSIHLEKAIEAELTSITQNSL